LEKFIKDNNANPIEEEQLMKLSKKCLSATEEVKMWLDHLLQVAENRKRGVQKSKEKRKNS